MKRIAFSVSVISAILFLVTGCASYNASPLSNLDSDLIITKSSHTSSINDIAIGAKAFNVADCEKYLDRNVIAEGYQPVQIYIQNSLDKDYIFSLNSVSVPTARAEEVANKVHTNTAARAAGYGAGALFFWPLAIPAIVDGVGSSEANNALDRDFSAKTARDQVIVRHSHFNKLIFIPVDEYQPTFVVKLIERDSGKEINLNVNVSG